MEPSPPLSHAEWIVILFIAVYFVRFTWDGLTSYYSHDDLMNLHGAWRLSLLTLLKQNLLLEPSYRPFGALWYKLTYELFGFNPFPLKVVMYAFVCVNCLVTYNVANHLSASRRVAIFTLLLYCYHSHFSGFYYNTGSCYDILCFTFYFGALLYYWNLRTRGAYLNARQDLVLCALYLLALDSKEMAVTLPVMLLAWEVVCRRPVVWDQVLIPIGATWLLTLLYVAVKLRGDSLVTNPAYRPVVTLANYLRVCEGYLVEAFFRPDFNPLWAAVALVGLLGLALLLQRSYLVWGWLLVVLGILPVAFISPRGLYSVYIPLLGMAIIFAAWLAWIGNRVLRFRCGWIVLLFATGGLLASQFLRFRDYDIEYMLSEQRQIKDIVAQYRQRFSTLPRGGRVLILRDPFDASKPWASIFILQSLYHDPLLNVDRAKVLGHLPDPAMYHLVLTFDQNRLVQLNSVDISKQVFD